MRPGMPKAASMTSIASNNSRACACTCAPIMCAFKKYSSLWMTTRNISDAIATDSETLRLKITMIVLERRFPTTGSSPTRKVMTSTVLASGRCTPANGNATNKYSAVRKVLTAEMRVWANTTRRNASPTRTTRSRMALASGPRGSCGFTSCSDANTPIPKPKKMCANVRPASVPTCFNSPACRPSQATTACRSSSTSTGNCSAMESGNTDRQRSMLSVIVLKSVDRLSA